MIIWCIQCFLPQAIVFHKAIVFIRTDHGCFGNVDFQAFKFSLNIGLLQHVAGEGKPPGFPAQGTSAEPGKVGLIFSFSPCAIIHDQTGALFRIGRPQMFQEEFSQIFTGLIIPDIHWAQFGSDGKFGAGGQPV